MLVTTLFIASTLFSATPTTPKKGFPDFFEACQCQYIDEQHRQKSVAYHLFVPRSLKPTERCPLLVWPIFGDWLNRLVFDDLDYIEKYRFFILVIGASHEGFDEILREIVSKYPVDQNRVYLIGPSRGGWVCWNIAMRYPDLVAAIVPMGAPRADTSTADKLVKIPIWAFHSRDETYIPRAGTEEMVAAVKKAGGNVHLTLIPSTSHDCWSTAFQQHDILAWLLSQRRRAWVCWTPPGTYPWKWRHILTVPCVFSAIVGLGWYLERKRRHRKKRRTTNRRVFGNNPGQLGINDPIW